MNKNYQNALKLACLCFVLALTLTLTFTPFQNDLTPIRSTDPADTERWDWEETVSPAPDSPEKKRLVVASIAGDDTTWLAKRLPEWEALVYVANDQTANLTVPINKGRESMVYLTYIIDHYDDDNLADIQVFMHSLQYQWHNDDSNKDGATVISRLQLPYIRQQGYVNMRCTWSIGCPAELPLDHPRHDLETSQHFRQAFIELFPERAAAGDIPTTVAASCCAQFIVTKTKLKEKPLSEYVRVRDWLLNTPLPDDISGRIMEYSWHMFFGQPDVHCPRAQSCYCNVFGLCGLDNCTDGECEGQYTLPQYSTMPQDWKPLAVYGQH